MGIFSFLNRRADDEAARESIEIAAAAQAEPNNRGRWRFRDNDVLIAAKAKWNLNEDQLAFLRMLLDTLGPLLLVLLRAFLKV